MKGKTLTYKQALEEGQRVLSRAGIEEAKTDAFLLFTEATGIDRGAYYLSPDKALSAEEEERYLAYLQKRERRIPLQHILGKWEFMGLEFLVSPDVLIPRQETEQLVEEALGKLTSGMRILDMCCGSGCILLSVLKLGREQHPSLKGLGVDLSAAALAVSRKNSERLQVEADFIRSDLFAEVTGEFSMIISNPPYIRSEEIKKLASEVREHDPLMALDGGRDGLDFYRRISQDAKKHLKSGGFLLLEIGHDQGEALKTILTQDGYDKIQVKKDFAGLDRVVCCEYNKID
ncbi:peptide chain release factor N(5)-glutamine methyltransferase [Ohessyouella blattaphilus]|uniref:Release factor glutamine methyltransferase n=1 Tax=Ohessyouella blattaphilus TaxID=2949333 RepID=A0ABT1EKE3_9FIRM|nr:peptide chain release factor N(5)-glutamine methyltransferase [Ohessyouella blattaphilus]MCP1110232.1 peptide chain release factor N(5)-glutamine methyltransferase [Ohessyouella blattaphilus]MCR8563626.1 peptide chain release factor N(5)-glutamine methyltransferase [Ohessyouella blattaphilus]